MGGEQLVGKRLHQFHLIMDQLAALPETDVDHVEQLLQVGEWNVAFENLCTQVYEYELALSATLLALIVELGKELGVREKYWRRLHELLIDP